MNKRTIIGIFIAVLLLGSSWTVFAEQTGSIESVGTVGSEGEVENTDLNAVTEQNVENDGEGVPTPEVMLEATMEAASASELTAEPTLTAVLTPEPTEAPTEEPTPSTTPEPTEEPSTTPEPTDTPTPEPTDTPTPEPTDTPTPEPTDTPTPEPTDTPTPEPTDIPTPEPTTTPTPEETTEPRQGPLRDSEPSISATVTWGDMNFTYDEAEKKWSCVEDSNKVIVLNNSDSSAITATYSYDPEGEYSEYGMSIFSDELYEYSTEGEGAELISLAGDGTFTTGSIAIDGTDSRWLMFTEPAGVELASNYIIIGTLRIDVNMVE